ncbi:Eukaryotic translation initiation factor 2A (eIF-2A) [Mucor velutinosus]|uniref:Eukaryotic translation initiation factor 2A (eIF-2A) n=1 Tax=Mucor velutinosus TaxID=708070 RepID=A0AAN7DAS6_9FUNG|nr:Eukaryotic translation initiation factor 2A (eIF-2A) [Mucor velutinosus]
MKQNPILIPEISRILCSFVDTKDLLNLALTCRAIYHTSCFGLWNTLNPKSHRILRKIKNTLDHTSTYNKYVWKFCLSSKQDIHHLERFFFDHFLFPNLRELKFSNAAAQDHILYPMIASAQKSLSSLNLSKCYCLSTAVIKPLLSMSPHQLESLVLYGCGKLDAQVLVEIIHRHCHTLKRLRLTDVNDAIMDAIQHCKKLNDLGLEHCSDITLSSASLTRFFASLSKNQVQLTHLRFRDIDSLTCQHLQVIAKSPSRASLVRFDMSECNRINAEGISWLATECIHLRTLLLAYQEGVTNQAIQLFIQNCHQLKHVDVSGCRLLTDHAFFPLLDAIDDNLMKITLETLNVSGLDLLSPSLIHQLLSKISSLQELCLGVTYDLDEADHILHSINHHDNQHRYYMDTEKFYTICKLPFNKTPPMDSGKKRSNLYLHSQHHHPLDEIDDQDIEHTTLPSPSTWNIPLL